MISGQKIYFKVHACNLGFGLLSLDQFFNSFARLGVFLQNNIGRFVAVHFRDILQIRVYFGMIYLDQGNLRSSLVFLALGHAGGI